MHKIIIILSVSIASCIVADSSSAAYTERNTHINEDFFVFFQAFCTDSAFQLSRIKFPLTETYLGYNLDSVITRRITKNDWKFRRIKKFETNTFEYYFSSFANRKLPETDEMVYSVLGIENGIQINYYFKRENGKWFLVKIEDLSTWISFVHEIILSKKRPRPRASDWRAPRQARGPNAAF